MGYLRAQPNGVDWVVSGLSPTPATPLPEADPMPQQLSFQTPTDGRREFVVTFTVGRRTLRWYRYGMDAEQVAAGARVALVDAYPNNHGGSRAVFVSCEAR